MADAASYLLYSEVFRIFAEIFIKMRVSIIGQGNVGTHLCVVLAGVADEVITVNSRTLEDLPLNSDIYLIAVKDEAVASVAERLPELSGIVAHTSGSVGADVLKRFERYGVFYPLQTFTKGGYLDYSAIPVFVEGSDKAVEQKLLDLASLFTKKLHVADSGLREKLHIAAVFACNFTNHLWKLADDMLADNGLGLDVIFPLIEASVEKLRYMSPNEAQTGPASRGDVDIIRKHEAALKGTPLAGIYATLSDSIMKDKE